MAKASAVKINICMGSSCFSRGNNRNIESIQSLLQQRQAAQTVELTGHLCQGLCKSGPNVVINGKSYSEVDPVAIIRLFDHYVPEKKP